MFSKFFVFLFASVSAATGIAILKDYNDGERDKKEATTKKQQNLQSIAIEGGGEARRYLWLQ